MLTVEQVRKAIEGDYNSEYDLEWYEEVSWSRGNKERYALTIEGERYVPEYVDDHGGMDQGSDRWLVFRLGDQLFKKSGFYASHYGTDWDGELTEVKPVTKPVVFYEQA